ncbi:hypothetical protein ACFL1X_12815, partial [Candidatus Hydrogenedentota bacterium]
MTDENGDYLVMGLGEEYTYTVRAAGGAQDRAAFHADFLLFLNNNSWTESGSRTKKDVRVTAGDVTKGVDFTLTPSAKVYGKVTDPDNGAPVYPLCIILAKPGTTGHRLQGIRTSTGPDGTYSISLDLEERTEFLILWQNIHLGGTGKAHSDIEIGYVNLEPGEEEEFDFMAPAPVTAPVRFVHADGESYGGIKVGIRREGPQGWRGGMTADANGRAVLIGLPPGVSYQALGKD